jgi:prephenate dehydrogenase
MVGLIGFGRFGKLTSRYLARDLPVRVHDRGGRGGEIEKIGAVPVSLQEACRQEIVILSVPISALESVLKSVRDHLRADSLVVDVCSVKTYPDRWMRELLPPSVAYLPTHPMFGPDSAADRLQGRKIVLCPGRVAPERYACIKSFLEKKGLAVIETSPEAHDREIAVSLALTHFIGRSLSRFGAENLRIDTEGYRRLLHILGVVENDTWQLFSDMNRFNPYAGEARASFLSAMGEIEARLKEKN